MSEVGGEAGKPARRRRRWLWVIVGLVVILAGVAMLALFPPASMITPMVAARIKAMTGLDMRVAGHARYTLLPRFVMHLEDVSLVSAADGHPIVRAQAVDAVLPAAVALGGSGDVLSLALVKPDIVIVRGAPSKDGAGSAQAAGAPLVVRAVSVSDGTLQLRDGKGGGTIDVTGISARSTLDAVTGGLAAEGKGTWLGEPVAFEITAVNGRKLLAGDKTDVKVKLDSRSVVKASFNGEVASGVGEAEGDLSLSSPSSKDIAKLIGVSTDVFLGEGAVSVATRAKARGSAITLQGAQVALGRSEARADLDVSLAGPRPAAKGAIQWKELDLTAFAPAPAPAPKKMGIAPETEAAGEGGLVIDSGYASLETALSELEKGGSDAEPGPSVAAIAPASDWSDAPFDLSRLAALDADVAVKADKVRIGGMAMQNGEAVVKLDAGKLSLDMKRVDVAQGQAKAKIGLDANQAEPHADIDVAMTGVAADQVLTELVGRPVLSGPADAQAKLAAKGKSVRQIVSSLDGQVRFAFGKGAIEGFDIPHIVQNIWSGWSYDKRYRTPFHKLEGQYAVRKGVAQSEKDAAFDGEAVDITASGKVSAPARTLDQRLRLSLSQSGWVLPVYLQGRWDKLKGGLDWGGLFAAPQSYTNPLKLTADRKAAVEAMPAKVREQIERSLARSPEQSKLSEPVRAMLAEMIAGEEAPPAAPKPE